MRFCNADAVVSLSQSVSMGLALLPTIILYGGLHLHPVLPYNLDTSWIFYKDE